MMKNGVPITATSSHKFSAGGTGTSVSGERLHHAIFALDRMGGRQELAGRLLPHT